MFKKVTIAVLCLVTFLLSVSQTRIGHPLINAYKQKDYDGGAQNWAVEQNSKGLIYVGNQHGLLEFDGVEWRKYRLDNRSAVRSIAIDKDDRVYVGGGRAFGYFEPDSLGQMVYNPLSELIADSTISYDIIWNTKVFNSYVVFQARNYLFLYDGNRIKVITPPSGVFHRTFNVNGECYISIANLNDPGNPETGLYKVNLEEAKIIHTGLGKGTRVASMTWIENDKSVVNFYNDFFRIYNLQTGELEPESDLFREAEKALSESGVLRGGRSANGNFLFATLHKGLVEVDPTTGAFSLLDKEGGLSSDNVNNFFEDQWNNRWLVLPKEIVYVRYGESIWHFGKNQGIEEIPYSSFLFEGNLYLGTSAGIYQSGNLKSVEWLKGKQDEAWQFLTFKDQLYSVHTSYISRIQNRSLRSQANSDIWTLIPTAKNPDVLISGNYNNGLSVYEIRGGSTIRRNDIRGFRENSRNVVEDFRGNLWVSDRDIGVWKLTVNSTLDSVTSMMFYNKENGLPADVQNYIFKYQIEGKTVPLIATRKGFYTFDYEKEVPVEISSLNRYLKNPGNIGNALAVDEEGNLCFMHKGMFTSLKAEEEGTYRVDSTSMLHMKGMSADQVQPVGNGSFVIAASAGFFHYNVHRPVAGLPEYQSFIRNVKVKGNTAFDGGGGKKPLPASVSYQNNTLEFEYGAAFSGEPDKLQFSYQLTGFDEGWSDWSNQTRKEYTNIPEGNYTFSVRAKNYFNQGSLPASFVFEVMPPWYRTYTAYTGYLMLAGLIIWSIVRVNSSRLRKEKQVLENLVSERTKEISHQADQLKEKNEKLQELDNFKQSMTGMIAHDLKTPLSVIMNSNEGDTTNRQMAGQMLQLINNMLDVQRFENAKVILRPVAFSLQSLVDKSLSFIEPLLSEKNLSIKRQLEDIEVEADEEIIVRVLINLLTNAVKYSPANETIFINGITENDKITISVKDKGHGIPKDQIETIFQSFGQLDPKTSGGVGSTGLGLTFVKLALEAHGSGIEVRSEQGTGTTFSFKLAVSGKSDSGVKTGTFSHEISLSKEEKTLIADQVTRLRELNIYQIGEIEKELTEIRQQENHRVQEWVDAVLNAAYAGNREWYEELLGDATSSAG